MERVVGETTKKKKPRAGMERKGWIQVPFRGLMNEDDSARGMNGRRVWYTSQVSEQPDRFT